MDNPGLRPDIECQIKALDEELASTQTPLAMARIYHRAACVFAESECIDEACYFMTQAFVLASQINETALVDASREFLQDHGRI